MSQERGFVLHVVESLIERDAEPSQCFCARPVQPFGAARKGWGTVESLRSKLESGDDSDASARSTGINRVFARVVAT